MSSRNRRKLQQQLELEKAAKKAQEEEEEEGGEESDEVEVQPTKSIGFAALLEQEEDEENPATSEDDSVNVESKEPSITPAPTAAKARKPKKKKKKSKPKAEEKSPAKDSVDEIDAALRDLNLKKPSANTPSQPIKSAEEIKAQAQFDRISDLLGIQTQHLKVANEQRKLFGKTALETPEDAAEQPRRRQRGQREQVDLETALRGQHPPGKGFPKLTLQRNTFIQGKPHWPVGTTGGLSMAMVDDQAGDGTVEFRFVHDQTYQALQGVFHRYVDIGDPQRLIELLIKHPYHISLLIQISKIAKNQGDHALSADLLERALFTFGRTATSIFNSRLAKGKVRLDFTRPENRELWLAGYHYIKSLIMKGTYRTAFEWAKLLLSLDPDEDPYCMRLMIYHLALRAHEYNWLLDIEEADMVDGPALGKVTWDRYHNSPSLAFAALQLKEGKKARELLSKSMKRLPWLYVRLFQDLNLDIPPSIWGAQPRTDAEELFTSIYIQQAKHFWDTTEATALLMEIAHTISKVDLSQIPRVEDDKMDLDVVRFVYLDDSEGLRRLLPSALLHKSNNSDSDPIPPDNNIFSYEVQRQALERPEDRGGFGDGYTNPLAALRRLLPNFRAEIEHVAGDDMDREEMERQLEAHIGGPGHEGEPSRRDTLGVVNSLFRLLWGERSDRNPTPYDMNEEQYEDEEDEDELSDDGMPGLVDWDDEVQRFVDAREEVDEETDDDLPDLVSMEDAREEVEETDDEMPPLVD